MSTSTPHWLLEAEQIVKRFGSHEVLRGVSVRARQGDVISMICRSHRLPKCACALWAME